MAITKIRGNTQILDVSIENGQIAYKNPTTNPIGIELVKIEDGEKLVKSDGSVPFTAPIAGVTPTQGNHLVTKDYADSVSTGLDVKESVRVMAASNITLAGIQPIDGVGVVAGDRVLVTGQAAPAENGIYVVSAGAWVRSTDADTDAEVTSGLFTFVEEGATKGSSGWVLATANPIVVGNTPLQFVQFSEAGQVTAGNGLTISGSTLQVNSANAGIAVNADDIELKLSADGTLQIKGDGLALASLAPGQIFVGNNGSVATATTLTGDVTVNSAGVTTIAAGAITGTEIADGSITGSKLDTNGAPDGSVYLIGPGGVPVFTQVSGDATIDIGGNFQLNTASVGTPELADAAVTLAKLVTIPAGQIIMGTSLGNVSVTPSGDVTISEAGVVTINAATVVRVADIIKRETPVGLVDGINTFFTLANTPKVGTEDVYVNGVLQESGAGNDYTISGGIITMLFALQAGDKLRVSYFK